MDTAFKKLSSVEQRLTYQSCYVCILVKGKLSVKSNHCKPNKDGTCITDKISQWILQLTYHWEGFGGFNFSLPDF